MKIVYWLEKEGRMKKSRREGEGERGGYGMMRLKTTL